MDNNFWQQAESRRLEYKERFPGGKQIAKTAIAFANGVGGLILFGIRNTPRKVVGIPDRDLFQIEEQIAQHIFDSCTPPIIPEIYAQHDCGKNVVVVEIYPAFTQ